MVIVTILVKNVNFEKKKRKIRKFTLMVRKRLEKLFIRSVAIQKKIDLQMLVAEVTRNVES